MKRRPQTKGYALFAVLGVLALLVIFLVTAQGSLLTTIRQSRVNQDRERKAEATAAMIAQVQVSGGAAAREALLSAPNGLQARVNVKQALADDPLWSEVAGLKPLAGDKLVLIQWETEEVASRPTRYIVNTEGKRHGVVRLGVARQDTERKTEG